MRKALSNVAKLLKKQKKSRELSFFFVCVLSGRWWNMLLGVSLGSTLKLAHGTSTHKSHMHTQQIQIHTTRGGEKSIVRMQCRAIRCMMVIRWGSERRMRFFNCHHMHKYTVHTLLSVFLPALHLNAAGKHTLVWRLFLSFTLTHILGSLQTNAVLIKYWREPTANWAEIQFLSSLMERRVQWGLKRKKVEDGREEHIDPRKKAQTVPVDEEDGRGGGRWDGRRAEELSDNERQERRRWGRIRKKERDEQLSC